MSENPQNQQDDGHLSEGGVGNERRRGKKAVAVIIPVLILIFASALAFYKYAFPLFFSSLPEKLESPFSSYLKSDDHTTERIETGVSDGVKYERFDDDGNLIFSGIEGIVENIDPAKRLVTVRSGDSFSTLVIPEDLEIGFLDTYTSPLTTISVEDIQVGYHLTYNSFDSHKYDVYLLVSREY